MRAKRSRSMLSRNIFQSALITLILNGCGIGYEIKSEESIRADLELNVPIGSSIGTFYHVAKVKNWSIDHRNIIAHSYKEKMYL